MNVSRRRGKCKIEIPERDGTQNEEFVFHYKEAVEGGGGGVRE